MNNGDGYDPHRGIALGREVILVSRPICTKTKSGHCQGKVRAVKCLLSLVYTLVTPLVYTLVTPLVYILVTPSPTYLFYCVASLYLVSPKERQKI